MLVNFTGSDDAGVYKLTEDCALVQTLDFFTPIVDDPFTFGQIAAANALSDVYAMGGVPVTAMNICAFPSKKFSSETLTEILRGGLSKLSEAGAQLLGGHTVEDEELKYGLSVTGLIHPSKIIKNIGAKSGDELVLTKALGTGIISTAIKADVASPDAIIAAVKSMTSLNKTAAEVMAGFNVHACTDVTGFGLAGHLLEMLADENLTAVINAAALPLLLCVEEYAEVGLLPEGLYRNRVFCSGKISIAGTVPQTKKDLLFDPETSGGLLIALPAEEVEGLVKALHNHGVSATAALGRITSAQSTESPKIIVE